MRHTFFLIIILFPALCQGQVVKGFKQATDRVDVSLSEGTLRIYPITENAVRIRFCKGAEVHVPELIFTSNVPASRFSVSDSPSKLEISAKNIITDLDKQTGKLSFADNSGKIFLSEKAETRRLIPDSVQGQSCYVAEQSFESPADEYLFGLGQFQDGHYNIRNVTRRLTQVNSQISIPFIYSSKGYGLLWHQYGLTDFNPADNFITLEKQEPPTTGNNLIGDVTTTSGSRRAGQSQSSYLGRFTVPVNSVYSICLYLGDMGNRQFVVIDGKPCIDQTNMWLPPTACTLINLTAGEHQVQLVCKST